MFKTSICLLIILFWASSPAIANDDCNPSKGAVAVGFILGGPLGAAMASSTKKNCQEKPLYYELVMDSVERPSSAVLLFGEIHSENGTDKKLVTEDGLSRIDWFVSAYDIEFHLVNKTDQTVKILWDDAAFVTPDGMSHRLVHSGIRNLTRNESMPPSVIIKKGRYEDVLIPADHITWTGDNWTKAPLLPLESSKTRIDEIKKMYLGKSLQVLLPFKVGEEMYEYLYIFKIADIKELAKK